MTSRDVENLMAQLLQKLKSLFRFRGDQPMREAAINAILHKGFLRIRNVDPDTDRQWLRLQRVIAHSETEASPMKPRLLLRFAMGVLVVAMAVVGGYMYFTSFQLARDMFATGRGQQMEVDLKDGSHVRLNYFTELVVPKQQSGEPRRVSLAGEAYFRVRHGETPFIVSTDYADVQVAGTEFNLRARESALEVAVIEGSVKVSALKDGKDSTLLLTQYQMAICAKNDLPKRIGDIPSPDYPGWMHGKLFLNKTSFLAACREIEMRFDISVKVDERSSQSEFITGILDARTAKSTLAALCEVAGKKFKYDGQTYVIY